MVVMMVPNVADDYRCSYTGDMVKPRNPDEISASSAMELLGFRSKPAFYRLVRWLRQEHGIELQHYANPWSKRAFYLRSQIEAAKSDAQIAHPSQIRSRSEESQESQ